MTTGKIGYARHVCHEGEAPDSGADGTLDNNVTAPDVGTIDASGGDAGVPAYAPGTCRIVFVTSEAYKGDVGGLAGGEEKCSTLAVPVSDAGVRPGKDAGPSPCPDDDGGCADPTGLLLSRRRLERPRRRLRSRARPRSRRGGRASSQEIPITTVTGSAEVEGGRLFYELSGEGPPVVLVHAMTLDHRCFDLQRSGLAKEHRVLRYDCRG
jgi:hypothetical protein